MKQEGTVDVLGIIHTMSAVSDVKLKNGTSKPKKSIEIVDNSLTSGVSITFTIWGDLCTSLMIKEGDLIAVKAGKVSNYGGKTLN